MYAASFTLDLYCENYESCSEGAIGYTPTQFVAYDRKEAFKAARKAGWTVNIRNSTCYCPKCSKKNGARLMRR